MKQLITMILFIVLSYGVIYAQSNEIPNYSFETWNGNTPTSWSTSNVSGADNAISPASPSYHGSLAAKGEVVPPPFPPLISWFPEMHLTAPASITENYTHITGYYKFHTTDPLARIQLNATLSDAQFAQLASASDTITSGEKTVFTYFSLPFDYSSTQNPAAYAYIQIGMGGSDEASMVGSYWIVDALELKNEMTDITDFENTVPVDFTLEQNYPNPFNPVTSIKFGIPEQSFVEIKVYSITGQEIATLVNQELPAGKYKTEWNGEGLSSGIYFYTLKTKYTYMNRKMILLK